MDNIFNRYYIKYDAWYENNKYTYWSELEAIKEVLTNKGKGLEIGVGTGRFASPLGIQFGVDPSKNMLKIAKQRGINVRLGFGELLPFRNGFFDYVAIINTLCFVRNTKKVLEEARRVLKKKGKLIIGIIDKNSFLGISYKKKKSIFYKHANFLSPQEIRNLLEGLEFHKFSYYQTIFKLPELINSIEKPLKGFGKGGFVVISGEKR